MNKLTNCPKCGAMLSIYLDKYLGEIYYCPFCKIEWMWIKNTKGTLDKKKAIIAHVFQPRKKEYNPSKKRDIVESKN